MVGRRVFLIGYFTFYIGQTLKDVIRYNARQDQRSQYDSLFLTIFYIYFFYLDQVASTPHAPGDQTGVEVERRVWDAFNPLHDGLVSVNLNHILHPLQTMLVDINTTGSVSEGSKTSCYI